jgi:hypothetical protein
MRGLPVLILGNGAADFSGSEAPDSRLPACDRVRSILRQAAEPMTSRDVALEMLVARTL